MLLVAFLSSVLCLSSDSLHTPSFSPEAASSRGKESYYLLAAADGWWSVGKDVAMLLTDKREAGNIERGSRCMLRLPHSTNARPIRVTQSSACQARPISKSPRRFIGCNKTPFLPYYLRDNGLRDTALAFTQHRGTSPNAKAHAARYHWPQAFTKLIMDMGSRPGIQSAGMVALERTSALSVRCGNDSIVLTPDQECLKGLGAARPTASGKLVPRNQTVIASS